jgi:phage terminase large subunit
MQALQSTSNNIVIPKAFKELFSPKRYKVYYGGRGGAKSHNFARALLVQGMQEPLRIICCREIQKSIDDSVHALLSDIIKEYNLEWFYKVQSKNISGINGTEIKYRGLRHNTTDLKSLEGADRLWIEEAENVSNGSYEIVIPTVRKENSEIWVSFNPKNPTDPTWKRFVQKESDRILAKKVSWRDNPFFPQVLEDERRELEQDDPEAYEHIWEGEFDTRYSGAVYAKKVAKLRELGRITHRVKHDPNFPVYVTFDLGWGDATAMIFYQVGEGEVFIIDYYENNTEDIRHYAEVLYGKEIIIDERDLTSGEVLSWHFGADIEKHSHRKEYHYEAIFLPHDSKNRTLAAEGRNVIGQVQKFGFKAFYIEATSDRNRHEATWATLPKCWIDDERCEDLIEALMYYHFEYDDDRKVFKEKPVHDWSSHACSAMELLSRVWRDKTITMKDITRRDVTNKFHRLRHEHGLVAEDPYRLKPMRKK